jgi:hypothetical protein
MGRPFNSRPSSVEVVVAEVEAADDDDDEDDEEKDDDNELLLLSAADDFGVMSKTLSRVDPAFALLFGGGT